MPHWIHEFNLSGRQAKSFDGQMLGIIEEVDNNYVLTENESKFYIPTYLIDRFDGNAVWFRIDRNEAKSKFVIAAAPI